MSTSDGDPLVGVVIQTDYKAEEEFGISDLFKAFTGPNPRRFQMLPAATDLVTTFTDVTGMALSTRPGVVAEATWGTELLPGRSDYAEEWAQHVPQARGQQDTYRLQRLHVQDLREKARELGISPLPRRKNDLVAAIAEYHPMRSPDQWPQWFQTGDVLVLRADSGVTRDILNELVAAARRGTLGFGTASGPFDTGLFLYDAADETPGLVAEREERADWYADRMAELAPVAEELEARGHSWFFLGNPRMLAKAEGDEAQVHYWLNGRGSPQPYGWYTLDQLLAEDFVADAAARESRRGART